MMSQLRLAHFSVAIALAAFAAPASAESLKIGVAAANSSLDPHFHNIGTNNSALRNVYDRLIHMDESMRLQPGLATAWTPVDDRTWEIELREGVTFHDGTNFGPEDVIFTFDRVPNVPNSPSSFARFVEVVETIEQTGPTTIVLTTKEPVPLLPNNLAQVAILSLETVESFLQANPDAAEDPLSVDSSLFNSGELAIGTGAYRVVDWEPDSPLVLSAYENYWGEVPAYTDVTLRPIGNDAARLAALEAGDVDLIDDVPTSDIERVRADQRFEIYEAPSNLAIYLHLDSDRAESPDVTAIGGGAIENPLRDVRVREAISRAINRDGIARAIMDGAAKPAGQMLDVGFAGASPTLEAMQYDPEAAKALLSEAGLNDGFAVTLRTPNDRYVNDERIALAIAQNLTQVGIRTDVMAEPRSTYFGNASKLKYSLMLLGWGSSTGEQGSTLDALLHSYNQDTGQGRSNRGRFSDETFDAMISEAMAIIDEDERNALVAKAAEYAIGERLGIIPIHFQTNVWAARNGVALAPRADNYTIAADVSSR